VADPPLPILTAIIPLQLVPDRLRAAVRKVVTEWSYSWDDVTFAATAEFGRHKEIWVFALTAGPLAVGDQIDSTSGRAAGVGVSAFTGGVIPVTPYQARVYEYLGRRGGEAATERHPPPATPLGVPRPADVAGGGGSPLISDTEPATPGQPR
jgi:hypothetical protein